MTEPEETPKPQAVEEPKPEPEKPAADPDGGSDFDKDRALATIRTQRESEKQLKADLKAAQELAGKWKQHEADQLSEQEKAQQRAADAEAKEAKANDRLRKANLIAALADPTLGIVNARAAAKLIEGVEFDDDGEPTNIGKLDEQGSLIATFLADHAFLRGTTAKPNAPTLNGGDNTEKLNLNLTAEEVRAAEQYDMTHEEYAVFKNGGSLADLQKAGLKKD